MRISFEVDQVVRVAFAAPVPGPALADAANSSADAAEADLDSPKDAERLQTRGFAETTAEAFDGGLFGSNSQEGAEPRVPGLPDFARGA
jgi:hypothetical protein